jgi:hypothetical protein
MTEKIDSENSQAPAQEGPAAEYLVQETGSVWYTELEKFIYEINTFGFPGTLRLQIIPIIRIFAFAGVQVTSGIYLIVLSLPHNGELFTWTYFIGAFAELDGEPISRSTREVVNSDAEWMAQALKEVIERNTSKVVLSNGNRELPDSCLHNTGTTELIDLANRQIKSVTPLD